VSKPSLFSPTGWLALILCAPVGAEQYSITEIPQLTSASGINRHADVVGSAVIAGSESILLYVHRSGVVNALPLRAAGGINDPGQIAGTVGPALQAAVAYETGGVQPLGAGPLSISVAISDSGFVVGTVGDFHARSHAVLWRLQAPATTTELGSLVTNNPHGFIFDPESDANAVNDAGVVVGDSDVIFFDSDGNPTGTAIHAFRWQSGVMTDLGTLAGGDDLSRANGINDRGEIVGISDTATGAVHAFLVRRNHMLDLGTLDNDPKLTSAAEAINDEGEVVGSSQTRLADNSVVQRAFLYRDGRMRDLTALIERHSALFGNVTLTDAPAISCNGWIAANGVETSTQAPHAYVLIPRDGRGRDRDDKDCRQR
jgi:probable HAF family extracellular repeat protein